MRRHWQSTWATLKLVGTHWSTLQPCSLELGKFGSAMNNRHKQMLLSSLCCLLSHVHRCQHHVCMLPTIEEQQARNIIRVHKLAHLGTSTRSDQPAGCWLPQHLCRHCHVRRQGTVGRPQDHLHGPWHAACLLQACCTTGCCRREAGLAEHGEQGMADVRTVARHGRLLLADIWVWPVHLEPNSKIHGLQAVADLVSKARADHDGRTVRQGLREAVLAAMCQEDVHASLEDVHLRQHRHADGVRRWDNIPQGIRLGTQCHNEQGTILCGPSTKGVECTGPR
mmetsp:Transcript_43397/g.125240  ORF Transcript_43397/g.125240 Transcript_43397/m.125240 type:complete len:281 (-) Transcript_43397:20-862(-)